MSEELEACPLCGGKAECGKFYELSQYSADPEYLGESVVCLSCGLRLIEYVEYPVRKSPDYDEEARLRDKAKSLVIKRWNTRIRKTVGEDGSNEVEEVV